MQEKAAKVKIESTEKLPKYNKLESIVELETQRDHADKENETDEEIQEHTTYFKNTKLPLTNEDLENIINKRMLSENVIHGLNIFCRRQFEHVVGL